MVSDRSGGDLHDPLTEADRLVARGLLVEAVDLLAAANRSGPTAELQVRLVELRHRAAQAFRPRGRHPWPPSFADPFPDLIGRPPEIERDALRGEVMGAAIAHHGSLIVRGLFDDEQVARGRQSIRDARRALEAGGPTGSGADYRPFPGLGGPAPALRKRAVDHGGVWLADSPAATAQVLDDLERCGATAAIIEHFGERPVFSLQKSTLRRVSPEFRFTGWHQDGSFLGAEVRALNVWVALTPCGEERPAPGLEIVPRRVDELLDTDGGSGSASINGFAVHLVAGQTPVIRPEFDPGDALLFDDRMIHRTYLSEDMTEERLAIECWFFAASHPADNYLTFLV